MRCYPTAHLDILLNIFKRSIAMTMPTDPKTLPPFVVNCVVHIQRKGWKTSSCQKCAGRKIIDGKVGLAIRNVCLHVIPAHYKPSGRNCNSNVQQNSLHSCFRAPTRKGLYPNQHENKYERHSILRKSDVVVLVLQLAADCIIHVGVDLRSWTVSEAGRDIIESSDSNTDKSSLKIRLYEVDDTKIPATLQCKKDVRMATEISDKAQRCHRLVFVRPHYHQLSDTFKSTMFLFLAGATPTSIALHVQSQPGTGHLSWPPIHFCVLSLNRPSNHSRECAP